MHPLHSTTTTKRRRKKHQKQNQTKIKATTTTKTKEETADQDRAFPERFYFQSSDTSDIDTHLAMLHDAWRSAVRARAGFPGVSIR